MGMGVSVGMGKGMGMGMREMKNRLIEQVTSLVEWYSTIRDLIDKEKV